DKEITRTPRLTQNRIKVQKLHGRVVADSMPTQLVLNRVLTEEKLPLILDISRHAAWRNDESKRQSGHSNHHSKHRQRRRRDAAAHHAQRMMMSMQQPVWQ